MKSIPKTKAINKSLFETLLQITMASLIIKYLLFYAFGELMAIAV